MAKVAMLGSLTSNTHPFGVGGGDASKLQAGSAPIKRKTPSELRSEQLKRKCSMEVGDESDGHFVGTEKSSSGTVHGIKKLEALRNTKYVDTRLDEVYPARKSNITRKHTGNVKDNYSREQNNNSKSPPFRSDLDDKSLPQVSCPNDSVASAPTSKDNKIKGQSRHTTDKCSQNTFLNVAVLSKGNENSCGQLTLDMNSVLKGLGRDAPTTSKSLSESLDQLNNIQLANSGRFRSNFQISGHKTPIDLTLKSSLRLVSSSSVNWCHRLITNSTFYGITQFMPQIGSSGNQSHCNTSGSTTAAEVLFSKALHSWVFPQSSLPPSVISALNLTSSRGELDFLSKRQMAWEDSFRSLYYMLRKSLCNIFYVFTSQFVVMFTAGHIQGKTERSCNVFMSRSTTGLRSLLKEHDISFSMPLCLSEVEQATMEDLVELSEIGKHNVGQTRHLNSMSGVDNNSQSLLAFSEKDVHGLYEFLLNYRSFLISLNGVDVPVLYSPVPFQSASLFAPEVKCRELKTVDAVVSCLSGSSLEDVTAEGSVAGVCYSIEIKDAIIPPWTISGLCAAMGADGRSFGASFTDEPAAVGLNVAFDSVSSNCDIEPNESDKDLPKIDCPFGVSEAVIVPYLRSATLSGLKYSNGSYTAALSPV
ncbi:protein downstream neighbor of Son-like isoform X1 [Papaver somniferum]|uniref:protein downstream neighbor of Son-like isoform X1 n=2 Tax=Papaver somniferum TaxID=3469 RepID=UPI000E70424C|nr:protein downstream neighbor of Son-like isoform X1 [Papaver somniferum]